MAFSEYSVAAALKALTPFRFNSVILFCDSCESQASKPSSSLLSKTYPKSFSWIVSAISDLGFPINSIGFQAAMIL